MNAGVKLAAGAVAGVAIAAGVRAARARGGHNGHRAGKGRAHLRGVTVNRPPEEVYAFWRDLPRLARAVQQVVNVEEIGGNRSRWVLLGPAGRKIEFTAETIIDEPGKVLAWRSIDSPVSHEGRVEFNPAPGNRGTELRVGLTYKPPMRAAGAAMAWLAGEEPDQLLRNALRRVKQLLEAGEVVLVEGQPSGRGPVKERITEAVVQRVAVGGRS